MPSNPHVFKKPGIVSLSIPQSLFNFKGKKIKGTRTLKNDVEEVSDSRYSNDHESVRKAGSAGTSDEWTDLEGTIMESSTLRSSLDQILIASSRWLHSIDLDSFNYSNPGAPLASSTPQKSSFVKSRRESSNDYSPVEQVRFAECSDDYSPVEQARFADSFEFKFGAPVAASTPCSPNSSLVKDGREIFPEGAKYWSSFERSKPESSFVEDKNLDDLECFQFKEPPIDAFSLYKKASFFRQDNVLLPETATYRNSFVKSFEKESSKSSCDTLKEIYPPKIPERRRKSTRKNLHSGYLLVDKKPKRSKGTSKQESEVEPTKNLLSRCDENSCPLRIDLVPGPERSSSPLTLGGDVPIDFDDFECFQFQEPSTAASPLYKKASFPKQNSGMLLEAATNRNSFEKSFEKESSKSSCVTQRETHPAKISERKARLKKRKLYSGELFVDKKPKRPKDTSKQASEVEPTKNVLSRCDENSCPLRIDLVPSPERSPSPLILEGDVVPIVLLPEAAAKRNSFEKSFEEESSKSLRITQKQIHPAKISERRARLKKRKLFSGYLLDDKKTKRSKGTSKKVSEVASTKNVLSRCVENMCPLGINLVPGPKRSKRTPSPPFFRGDVPLDDIYLLINRGTLKSEEMRTKYSIENKSRKKYNF